jgi:hypothetical protein
MKLREVLEATFAAVATVCLGLAAAAIFSSQAPL